MRLLALTLGLFGVGMLVWTVKHYIQSAPETPPPPAVSQTLTPGYHLIKMQRGPAVTLEIINCDEQVKCTLTGDSFDPGNSRDIKRALETFDALAHPPENKLVEVLQ